MKVEDVCAERHLLLGTFDTALLPCLDPNLHSTTHASVPDKRYMAATGTEILHDTAIAQLRTSDGIIFVNFASLMQTLQIQSCLLRSIMTRSARQQNATLSKILNPARAMISIPDIDT